MNAAARGGGRLRILLVAYSFPPMNSIGSHRPYGWARCWRDLGHDVHVLTPAKHAFDGPMDLLCDLSGIDVHEVRYLPARRVDPDAAPGGAHDVPRRWERFKTATRRARFSLAMFGDPRLLAYSALVREGLRLIRSHGFDLIIATSPPEVSFLAARTLSRRTGVPWVADFRDLWFRDMRLYQSRAASWLSGLVHRWLVRNAAALVTVSVGLQKRLASNLGRDVLVSYNGYFEHAAEHPARSRAWSDDRIHIAYTGRVYPGKQDPEPLFRALDALRRGPHPPAKGVVVDFYGFEDPLLRLRVVQLRLEDYVHFHGHVPYRESLAVQRAADALLFLDWTDVSADGVLTGKLFEYFGSRRPIVAIGPRRDSEAAALIADTQCGVTLTSEEEILEYLSKLAVSAPLPAVNSPARERLSREKQARAILDELKASLF